MKKLLLLGTILIAAGCAPRRDEICCISHTLSKCEPAIYFEYDSAKIDMGKTANRLNLNWTIQKLIDWPDRTVILIGHTDLKGSEDYNSKLSGRRAAAIQEQLILNGVDPNRIKIEALGMIDPVTEDENEQALNRRVDITFGHKGRTFFQAFKENWNALFAKDAGGGYWTGDEDEDEAPATVKEVKKEAKKTEVKAEEVKAEAKADAKEIKNDIQKDAKDIKEDVKKDASTVQQ